MRQNLEGVPIPNCSEYITLHVYQFWCFYEKVNNSPKISLYRDWIVESEKRFVVQNRGLVSSIIVLFRQRRLCSTR